MTTRDASGVKDVPSDDASRLPHLGARWISNRIVEVDPGRLVAAPARCFVRSPGSPDTVRVELLFLDPRTGRGSKSVRVGRTPADLPFGSSVSVSPDRRRVAATSPWRTIVVDAGTYETKASFEPTSRSGRPPEPVVASAWSPDGSRLLLGSAARTDSGYGDIAVFDPLSKRVERTVPVHGGVRVMEWSPDHDVLAVGQEGFGKVTILDSSLQIERELELDESDYPFDLAFSPDGSRLAVGGVEGRVSVFDTSSWELVHEPALVHGAEIVDVGWLRDGTTVVASGMDERASLYDSARDLVRAGPFPASAQPADGRGYAYVVPGAEDELVLLGGDQPGLRYPLDPAVWLVAACRIAGRDLTRSEWRTYLPGTPYRQTCAEILGGDAERR